MAKQKQIAPSYEELAAILRDLLQWSEFMGGFEAPCWKRADRLDRRLRDVAAAHAKQARANLAAVNTLLDPLAASRANSIRKYGKD